MLEFFCTAGQEFWNDGKLWYAGQNWHNNDELYNCFAINKNKSYQTEFNLPLMK